MDKRKLEKFASIIREELGEILLREFDLPKNSFLTITKVIISTDRQKARIFLATTPAEQLPIILKILSKRKKYLRSRLAHRLQIRKVPSLYFLEDKTMRVEELLKKIH